MGRSLVTWTFHGEQSLLHGRVETAAWSLQPLNLMRRSASEWSYEKKCETQNCCEHLMGNWIQASQKHKLNLNLSASWADESHSTVHSYPFPIPLPSEVKNKTNVENRPQFQLIRPRLPLTLKEEPKFGDRTSQVNYIFILRSKKFKPSLLYIVYNPISPKVVFIVLDISKCVCEIEIQSTWWRNDHEMVRVVWVVCGVVFWKRRYNPSLPGHEGARVENSPWNQNLIVSFVN